MEPQPPDPGWPRYSQRLFPAYRFIPGQSPHPRRDPKGHSFGQPEPKPPAVDPEKWKQSEWYLYGIDLYNFAYWWECHEALEGLWHAAGRVTPTGQFLQGIIQVSAANLKRFMGSLDTAKAMAHEGVGRFKGVADRYMGVDLPDFQTQVNDYFQDKRGIPALITLHFEV